MRVPTDRELINDALNPPYKYLLADSHSLQYLAERLRSSINREQNLRNKIKELELCNNQLEDGVGEEIQMRILEHEPVIERLTKENQQLTAKIEKADEFMSTIRATYLEMDPDLDYETYLELKEAITELEK